eukprot:CAMPEP_0183309860 /NCGR_PEP_ID=MMETSP0160_2-20130417/25951_1 /TAXON_ID=2839 ORGANISM="Odontella Sinensis, Strain Grunow 1884" /NCGR_SAMPLE_ID=MMETSP0160_2 /ASSEMBLY_ACC=CAM_ASM_000250 /LENGTH=94 /DNA_ID=CAMNT_0025473959 /DNA_START=15 /DNA_END=295 /DNA_ORIENTATION=+
MSHGSVRLVKATSEMSPSLVFFNCSQSFLSSAGSLFFDARPKNFMLFPRSRSAAELDLDRPIIIFGCAPGTGPSSSSLPSSPSPSPSPIPDKTA